MIKQSSGEDWIATKVSLSTATPSKGGSPPTLDRNYLRVKRSYPTYRSREGQESNIVTIPTIGFPAEFDMRELYSEKQSFQTTMLMVEEQKVTLHSTQFVQRFDTARPATIPSDGTEHKVNNKLAKHTNTHILY